MIRASATLIAVSVLTLAASPARASVQILPGLFNSAQVSAVQARAAEQGRGFAVLFVNDTFVDLSGFVTPPTGPGVSQWSAEITAGGAAIAVSATFDADPFISIAVTTTNLIATPVTYTFLFGLPIVPGSYSRATAEGTLDLTNPAGTGVGASVENSAVYPTYLSGYGTVGFVPTNLGVDLGTGTVTAPSGTTTMSFGPTSNTFPPTFYDNLEALLTYTQTGFGSVAQWSANVTLTTGAAVPEPMTLAGATLAALAGIVRMHRRRQAP